MSPGTLKNPYKIKVEKNFSGYNFTDFSNYVDYLEEDKFYDQNFLDRLINTA
jgi:hypothetical protein